MKSNSFFAFFTLLSLAACGNGGGGGGAAKIDEIIQEASQEVVTAATPGTYYTVLRPVNIHSNGFIPYGAATFNLLNDQLKVEISMDDDQRVAHRQTLHLGSRCPTLADDTNGDGFVDYDEAQKVVGPALMPLDDDLNSQSAGSGIYPKGPGLTYKKFASLAKINADLWQVDADPSDNVIKLPKGQGIGFEGRVVLVHGTSFQNAFPPSLATYPGEAAHLSLPVTCGALRKID